MFKIILFIFSFSIKLLRKEIKEALIIVSILTKVKVLYSRLSSRIEHRILNSLALLRTSLFSLTKGVITMVILDILREVVKR